MTSLESMFLVSNSETFKKYKNIFEEYKLKIVMNQADISA